MNRSLGAPPLVAILLWASACPGAEPSPAERLLERIRSPDVEVRYAARFEAPRVGAEAVQPLAGLIDETVQPAGGSEEARRYRREVALTAKAALENIVHSAGGPGAAGEREAVAAKLAELLSSEITAKAKIEILHLVAFVAGDAHVPAVAHLLDDPDRNVRETARIALERIPGKAATRALVAAAQRASDEARPALLVAIGRKGDPEGVAALLESARSGPSASRLAALKGLAHAGAAEAVPLFESAAASAEVVEKATVFAELLRLADELEARELRREASALYALASRGAPLDHQRERALFRLSEGGRGTESLIAALGDEAERVRAFALARLRERGAEVAPAVRKAYDEAPRAARPALLRLLAERDPAGAEALLAEASASPDAELKLAALDVRGKLDDPSMEGSYLEIARGGSPSARPVALRGYLLLAEAKLARGEAAEASAMFARALELESADAERIAALRGLVAAGNPADLPAVAGLLKSPSLAAEAARGVVALAPKLEDKDEAEKRLLEIVTAELPKEIRSEAVEALRKIGRDPQVGIRKQGFVLDWWVVTPIPDPDGKGLERRYFPEERIRLGEVEQAEGKRHRWQKLTEVSLDGRFNLLTSFRRTENAVTYAYAEIESPEDRDVLFKMGSDDGIACWLNGERIHLNDALRGLAVDQDVVRARLRKGTNRVLLKIRNATGDWGFAFRVTDPEGRPLDLSR